VDAELAPLIEESGVPGKRAAELKTTVSEYEREARDLMKNQSMAKCQASSTYTQNLETAGVSQPDHERAKKLWAFSKDAAADLLETRAMKTGLDATIADSRANLVEAKKAQRTPGVGELAAEQGLKDRGVDRQAFYSGAFVGEHAKKCLYNAKKLGSSVLSAFPPGSPLAGAAAALVDKHVRVWRLLAIIHALARPSRTLALEEVDLLETTCAEYGALFRSTFADRHVPLKTHVTEFELPRFARKWLAAGLFCEDAAESIHALKNRLNRRYACVRGDTTRDKYSNSALNLYQDKGVAKECQKRVENRRRKRRKTL
jgi:hypothetical protein